VLVAKLFRPECGGEERRPVARLAPQSDTEAQVRHAILLPFRGWFWGPKIAANECVHSIAFVLVYRPPGLASGAIAAVRSVREWRSTG